jgi:hypothetical protein
MALFGVIEMHCLGVRGAIWSGCVVGYGHRGCGEKQAEKGVIQEYKEKAHPPGSPSAENTRGTWEDLSVKWGARRYAWGVVAQCCGKMRNDKKWAWGTRCPRALVRSSAPVLLLHNVDKSTPHHVEHLVSAPNTSGYLVAAQNRVFQVARISVPLHLARRLCFSRQRKAVGATFEKGTTSFTSRGSLVFGATKPFHRTAPPQATRKKKAQRRLEVKMHSQNRLTVKKHTETKRPKRQTNLLRQF